MNAPRLARAALVAVVSTLMAGCGDEGATRPTGAFVGAVEGSDAVIGAAISDEGVTFYLCGGGATYDRATRWFKGADDGTGRIALAKDGWTIDGDLAAGTGTLVTPEGAAASWSARPSSDDTLEGLYAAVDTGGCKSGVVVTDDGGDTDPFVQGTWCDGAGRFAQITPILPIVRVGDGFDVRVDLPEGARTFTVKRVVPE